MRRSYSASRCPHGGSRSGGCVHAAVRVRTILLTDHGVRSGRPGAGDIQVGVNAPVGARAILPSEPVN
jgi:hypothetical protein